MLSDPWVKVAVILVAILPLWLSQGLIIVFCWKMLQFQQCQLNILSKIARQIVPNDRNYPGVYEKAIEKIDQKTPPKA